MVLTTGGGSSYNALCLKVGVLNMFEGGYLNDTQEETS